jgi:capsular polysaccharide biosynthesis protein
LELRGYGSIAKRWWFALLLAAWGGGLVGYVATLVLPPTYEARTQLLVGPIDANFTVQRASGNLARTFADLATSEDLLAAIVAELPGLDAEALEDTVRTTASDATRLVSILVQQPDPNLAAQAANAIVERLIQLTDSPNPEGRITVIDVANVPDEPIGPSVPLVVGMAAGAGLIGGVLLLFLWESVSNVVRGRDEAVQLAGAPLLAVLRRAGTVLEAARGSTSLMLLSAHVTATPDGEDARTVIVGTSLSDTSGAWTAAQLAAALAGAGRTVVVIDGGTGAATRLLTGARAPTSGSTPAAVDVELSNGSWIGLVPMSESQVAADDVAPISGHGEEISIVSAESVDSGTAAAWIEAIGRVVVVVTKDQTRREDLLRTASALSLLGAELVGIVVVEPVGRLGTTLQHRRPSATREPSASGAPPAPAIAGARRRSPPRRALTDTKEDARPRTQP